MLVHGELEMIARISECFGLLINGGFIYGVYTLDTLPLLVRN